MTGTNIKQEEVKLTRSNQISNMGILELISVGLFHGGKYFKRLAMTDMEIKENPLYRE